MRHQQRIYIQNAHSCLRNKDNLNVNMSSDMCEFQKPIFNMVGADKIKTGSTITDDEIHIITGNTIDLTFSFSGDVNVFIDNETTFNYQIHKYNPTSNVFMNSFLYDSGEIEYESFSATSAFTNSILTSDLDPDGEYVIKGNFKFKACTPILKEMGDFFTTTKLLGSQYGIYDENFDYYFAAINKAVKPIFALTPNDSKKLGTLRVESYLVDGGNQVEITSTWVGKPIVALNGITLAEGVSEDYTTEDNKMVNFNGTLVDSDIVTIAYINGGNPNGLISESIVVPNPIISGITDNQGSNTIYYNVDTNKYEVFLMTDPVEFNDIIITLNGVTLANGADYLQSVTDSKRIILSGLIIPTDIITMTYNSYATFVGTINVDNFDLLWTVTPPPTNNNGLFTALVAEEDDFIDIIYSATTPYVTNSSNYQVNIDVSGYTGTTAYYKVINEKDFDVLSGDTITTITESDIIPIEIQI